MFPDGCPQEVEGLGCGYLVIHVEQTQGQRQTGRNDLPGKGEGVASGW